MSDIRRILLALLFIVPFSSAQEAHIHSAPEKLGKVSFPISCAPAVQEQFDRGVALLHSFAYAAAEAAFQGVAKADPQCAMAHWGMAMTYFHQLWEPPIAPATITVAQSEIEQALQVGTASERERRFINALALIFQNAASVPYRTRALNYEQAMSKIASENRKDVEAQVFYALALLANISCGQDSREAEIMRAAADEEDAVEKLPVTPGPIVPAREQLGYLLLEQHQPALALKAFENTLTNAPGRRGALKGAAQATALSAQK